MATQAIRIEEDRTSVPHFRAVSGHRRSMGQTPGEALDSLLAQEGALAESSAILVQRFVPDAHFTQAQFDRMQELLARRDALTDKEDEELDALVDAELDATVARTDSLLPVAKP